MVKVGRGKFETVGAPLLLARECQAPFGIEIESRYTPKPLFAGGTDSRKYLTMQLKVSAETAFALVELDQAVCEASKWSPLVTEHDGRYTIKVRIVVEGPRPGTFRVGRVGDGQLQEAAWPELSRELDVHGCFRGAGMGMSVALRPAYIWAVSGRRGMSVICEQVVVHPSGATASIDYVA
jgi:hypothetical protein